MQKTGSTNNLFIMKQGVSASHTGSRIKQRYEIINQSHSNKFSSAILIQGAE
jgi:hypothetical protein